MSIISSIGNAFNSAYNVVSSFFGGGQSQAASVINAAPMTLNTASKNPNVSNPSSLPSVGETNARFIASNPQYGYGGGANPTALPGFTPNPVSYSSGSKPPSVSNYSSLSYKPSDLSLASPSQFSFSLPQNQTVSSGSLGSGTSSVVMPSAPTGTNHFSTAISGNVGIGATPVTGIIPVTAPVSNPDTTTKSVGDQLREMLNLKPTPETNASSYNRAVQETGLYQAQQQRLNDQNAVNAVTSKMNTDLLQLRGTAGKEGVTEAVYGGQQAEVTREATIKLLPLQAQLAVDQGNLELAQTNTNTLFKIYADDAKNSADFFWKNYEATKDILTREEDIKIKDLAFQKNFNAEQIKADSQNQANVANELLKVGNKTGYAAITAIQPPWNLQSPTFAEDYANYKKDLATAVSQYGSSFGVQGTIVNAGGRQILIDPRTGNTIKDLGTAPLNAYSFAGTPQGNVLATAIANGQIAPKDVNSRNASILANVLAVNPNFNAVQANAAATFFESTGTQDKLAWSNSVNSNLDILNQLSAKVSRSDFPAINKAILAGNTLTGDVSTVQFVNAANRTAAELSRVLGDSGGSDFRTRLANNLLDPSYSPEQFAGAIATEKQLISSLQNSFYSQGGQLNPNTSPTGTIVTAPDNTQVIITD